MSLQKKLLAFAAPIALMGLSACATGLPTQVSRFQAMPVPQGQSFVVVPAEGEKGGLEFSQYASLVSRHLSRLGYSEARSPEAANFVVELDYGVNEGRQRIVSRPDPFAGPGWGYGYRRPYYSRFGYFGRYRSPYYYGWDDPYWYGGGFRDRIESYTEYTSVRAAPEKRCGSPSRTDAAAKRTERTKERGPARTGPRFFVPGRAPQRCWTSQAPVTTSMTPATRCQEISCAERPKAPTLSSTSAIASWPAIPTIRKNVMPSRGAAKAAIATKTAP
jgi:hypothetical protein